MTMLLERGTKPEGLPVKTFGIPGGINGKDVVFLGDYEISIEDFLIAAHYVLTNSNLTENDPRLQFVECVRSMQMVKGYPGEEIKTKRLYTEVPPVLDKNVSGDK